MPTWVRLAPLWITPDQAWLDPQAGGIEIWPVQMPEDWDFNHASVERGGIRPLLVGKGDPIVVCAGSLQSVGPI
jgi:hypothetical protein